MRRALNYRQRSALGGVVDGKEVIGRLKRAFGIPILTGADKCGPNGSIVGADNNYFVVKIFMQDKYDYWGTEKIRRDINCHPEIQFDLKNIIGSNQNRQVNVTNGAIIDGCGIMSGAHGVEIRHVVVEDKFGNIVAKVSP